MMKNVKQQAGYIIIGGVFSQFVSALKIHCSEACKGLLDKLGGYKLEPRGLVEMKVNIYIYFTKTRFFNHPLVKKNFSLNIRN